MVHVLVGLWAWELGLRASFGMNRGGVASIGLVE